MSLNTVAHPHSLATYLRQSLTSACLLTSILRDLFCEVARPKVNCTFYLQNGRRHGYADVMIQHPKNKSTTEFSLHSSPHQITFSPGAAVAVATRLLLVGVTCQSIRGRFSRLTFLTCELSTNKHQPTKFLDVLCPYIPVFNISVKLM